MKKLPKIVMGLIGISLAIGFFLPPIIKLKEPAMIVVILIGVVAMIVSFIDAVREKDDV